MNKPVIVYSDDISLYNKEGVYISIIPDKMILEDAGFIVSQAEITTNLIKLGVTPEDIIKLKNQELL